MSTAAASLVVGAAVVGAAAVGGGGVAAAGGVAAGGVAAGGVAAGATGGVVLSELMYHAADGTAPSDDAYDFVELANTGADPVALTGWRLTGVTFTFPEFTLGAGERVVVAADATAFGERYGAAPGFVFAGGRLSNGGEEVAVSDVAGTVVDRIVYADAAPWPGAPDGNGPSLERVDLGLASTGTAADAGNWEASLVTHGTPGAPNSVLVLLGAPVIDAVDDGATRPAPGAPVAVSARVRRAGTVELRYRVMHGAPVTIPMADDADSAGGAGDGTWTAFVPPQRARTLVRYQVVATGDAATVSSPSPTATVPNHGFVVDDPGAPTDLYGFDWFMTPADYADMLANHRYDDEKLPVVVAVGDTVVDGARVRVRGGVTRRIPKPSLKIELPSGATVQFPQLPRPVDEFNLFWSPDPAVDVGWQIASGMGMVAADMFPMRSYLNGAFHGAGAYLSAYDGRWRDEQGYGDAAVYKGEAAVRRTASAASQATRWEKDEGADGDFTDIWQFAQVIDAPASAAQRAWIAENVDIPALVNYLAFQSFTRHWDSSIKNFFLIRNPEGTGRWSMETWDLDGIFQPRAVKPVPGDFLVPRTNTVARTMLAYPEIRAMFVRRLKTVIDTFPRADLLARYQATFDAAGAAWWADHAIWRHGPNPALKLAQWRTGVAERSALFAANTGARRLIPPSQTTVRTVTISAVEVDTTGGRPQTVALRNTGTESFDLSGWRIDAIGLVVPAGTVLLPGATVVFTADDLATRALTEGLFVGGEFPDALPAPGGTLTLVTPDGSVVHTVTV